MKRKWLAGLLILTLLCTLAGGGAILAFADDAKAEVKVGNVQYSSNIMEFAGPGLVIGMTDASGTAVNGGGADWDWIPNGKDYVKFVDKKGASKINILGDGSTGNIGYLGSSIIVNHNVNNAEPAVGDVFEVKTGLAWGDGETKTDAVYIYTDSASTESAWAAYAPTTFAATETTAEVMVGAELEVTFSASAGETTYADAPVTYTLSNENATVVGNGLSAKVTGVTVGTTTLTATLYGGKTATVEITVDVPQELDSISIPATEKIQVYKGATAITDADCANLHGTKTYVAQGDNPAKTSSFTVLASMLSAKEGAAYDLNTVGDYTVVVTVTDGDITKTCEVALEVIPLKALSVVDINYADWASSFLVNVGENTGIVGFETIADTSKLAVVDSQGVSLKENVNLQIHENYIFVQSKNGYNLNKVGVKISILQGFVWLQSEAKSDLTYILEEVNQPMVVYDASKHDVTSLEVTNVHNRVYLGTTKTIEWKVNDGAAVAPDFTSSDTTVATVDANGVVTGVAEGTATITIKAGSKTVEYEIEVRPALTIKTVRLVNSFRLRGVKGTTTLADDWQDVVFKTFTARVVFDAGKDENDNDLEEYGPTFAVTSENATCDFTSVNVNAEDLYQCKIVLTYEGETYDLPVQAEIYEVMDMEISEVAIVEWWNFCMFIEFPNSTTNTANITKTAWIPGATTGITYTRANGDSVSIATPVILGSNILISPPWGDGSATLENFNKEPFYMEGDKLSLPAGLTGYYWMGNADGSGTAIEGQGMVLPECVLREAVTYMFDGNNWVVYIPYTDVEAKDEVTVVIGQGVSLGAMRVPANATEGKLTYECADTETATVNTSGRVTGVKAGTTTVTVTLDGGAAGTKTTTVTVHVVDAITALDLNVEEALTVTQGTEKIDLSKLSAKLVWASGKEEDADLSNAEIIGYDKDVLGETEVTVQITVDGKTYSAQLPINVVKPAPAKKGCKGSVDFGFGSAALASVALLGVALAMVAKRKAAKDNK